MEWVPWLLLPVAAAAGWLSASKYSQSDTSLDQPDIDQQYLQGLNFLINEQPDKAIEALATVVDADHETVNTQLVLGALFRRRGEVDRAIKIHQNLITRAGLNSGQRESAKIELGTDYLKAGMFDRAEKIFTDLEAGGSSDNRLFRRLQEMYEQEKEWQSAIDMAKRLESLGDESQPARIAQYYCEISDQLIKSEQIKDARLSVNKAMQSDPRCLRAMLLVGDMDVLEGQFESAEMHYRKVFETNRAFAPLAYDKLFSMYADQNDLAGLLKMLYREGLDRDAAGRFTLLRIYTLQHDEAAVKKLLHEELSLRNASPNLVKRYLELMRESSAGEVKQAFSTLHQMLETELANYRSFRCLSCGYDTNTLFWMCPTCRKWGTVKPNRKMSVEYGHDVQL